MGEPLADDGTYALYRYFDVADRLLYIGISGDLAVRGQVHVARSRWMPLSARSVIEWHGGKDEVLEAERKAIEAEHPLFNVQWNDTPEARERLQAYLEEIGRLDLLVAKRGGGRVGSDAPAAERSAVTQVTAGRHVLQVSHGPGVSLVVSSADFTLTLQLTTRTACDLADGLKLHASDEMFEAVGLPSMAGHARPWAIPGTIGHA